MIQVLIALWILSALLILFEQKIFKMLVFLGVYSLITSIIFLVFGAPDVALAEASISIFATVFFVTCFEKYYKLKDRKITIKLKEYILPAAFTILLAFLFILHIPVGEANNYVMVQYITYFVEDVGGVNAVNSIILGYRLYDTVFETLMLMIAAVAISHVSWHKGEVATEKTGPIKISNQAVNIIRLICPLLLIFGIYLIGYGHISPGGGFQGGVALAAFFVCRYMVHDIHDLPIDRLRRGEKLVFSSIVLLSAFIIFLGVHAYFPPAVAPLLQNIFLISMNTLVGIKVALGFTMLFYRFIAIERL